ncbi:MAG: hypothetical protein WBG92_05385 [Thiohalocapsa sp.]
MLRLTQSARRAGTSTCTDTLIGEIASLPPGRLPLTADQGGQIERATGNTVFRDNNA